MSAELRESVFYAIDIAWGLDKLEEGERDKLRAWVAAAAEVTQEERDDVRWAHDCIVRVMQRDGVDMDAPGFSKTRRALAVLDRLAGAR